MPPMGSFIRSQLFLKLPYPEQDFSGQTVIVTGANTGLGLETARHITRLGAARVVLACRTLSKGETARTSIETSTQRTGVVEVWELDLCSFDSVKAFAARVNDELPTLHCVVENAGINTGVYTLVEGYESTLTVNVLSTFLLAALLLPKLRASAPTDTLLRRPRLVIVTSDTHDWAKFNGWDDADIMKRASEEGKKALDVQYFNSKLMEILLVRELVKHVPSSEVVISTANPGLCTTDIGGDMKGMGKLMLHLFRFLFARTVEVGSRNFVAAAAGGPEIHGEYVSDCKVDKTSPFVRSETGAAAGKRLYEQVLTIIENVAPGSTAALRG